MLIHVFTSMSFIDFLGITHVYKINLRISSEFSVNDETDTTQTIQATGDNDFQVMVQILFKLKVRAILV